MEVVDDRGVLVRCASPPRRIVSLVPSSTETLCELGLADRLVGRTRFCVHPAQILQDIPKVGGTKDVDPDRVRALEPDLIVGNCEENSREIFEALAGIAPLYAAFPKTVDDATADLQRLGELVGVQDAARAWLTRIQQARIALRAESPAPLRFAYLIWRDPWMTISGDTFISGMLSEAGLVNAFEAHTDRFPTTTPAQLRDLDLDLVLLSSEPFPFRARHARELQAADVRPRFGIVAADGEMLSWHGTRIAQGLDWLRDARHQGWPHLR